jgi:LuxR family maltose regulon positive regulatory protein
MTRFATLLAVPTRTVVMSGPLPEAKLHPPRRRRTLVRRPRLSARVAPVDEASLTLVSAPAGFGKTTLLSEWTESATDAGRAVAWLSLDAARPWWSASTAR